MVTAVQGAAVGGGLGLACAADFRVASPQARFCANFARLGLHHGFALTVTLPAIIGEQRAHFGMRGLAAIPERTRSPRSVAIGGRHHHTRVSSPQVDGRRHDQSAALLYSVFLMQRLRS